MKRWISLLLCLTLTGSVLPFALAEDDTADARLKRVTEQVKATLDLDTDKYTDFRGYLTEHELGTVWNLNWSNENTNLSIDSLENGTVVSYWTSDGADSYFYSQNIPAFPNTDPYKARFAAESFLSHILDERTETIQLKEPEEKQLRGNSTRFYGNILLNGLPSPLTYSITVRGKDNTVTSFRRDSPSRSFLGNIPSAVPAVSKTNAAEMLRDTQKLELLYVMDEAEEENQTEGAVPRAVLRYVPKTTGVWAVDAQTGEIKDISGSISTFQNSVNTSAEEAAMDSGNSTVMKSLTAVEQAGVEKLKGILDQNTLDQYIRSEAAYQLTDTYVIQTANYRLIKEDDGRGGEQENVICTLRYTARQQENPTPLYNEDSGIFTKPNIPDRTFTVDARTGTVRMLYSSESWTRDQEPAVSQKLAEETAQNFLLRFASAVSVDTEKVELYNFSDDTSKGASSYSFTFARKENGIFFPADSINIRIDCMTGAVSAVNYTWHKFLTDFPSPDGIVSSSAALNAWVRTYDVILAYRLLPKDLDASQPDEAKLISVGMTKFYSLFLSYSLERPDGTIFADFQSCSGIDAKTGNPVQGSTQSHEKIFYNDISGSEQEPDILKLASYGIGYAGDSFSPAKVMTQWDMICLLSSIQGLRLNPEKAGEEERNSAYSVAYSMGALTPEQRKDTATLKRGQAVRLLLNAAGCGPVARIQGIYKIDYTDSASISSDDLGYAALAQGLRMVQGRFGANDAISRAEAAVLLCRLMEREI